MRRRFRQWWHARRLVALMNRYPDLRAMMPPAAAEQIETNARWRRARP